MVETNNLVKKKLLLFVFGILFLVSFVSAATEGRVVYSSGVTSVNISTVYVIVNSSNLWDALDTPADIDLNDLGDVNAGAPADQDALTWDDGSSKWIPQAIAALSKWIVSLTNGYFYNSSDTIYFNDTRLNLTIDSRMGAGANASWNQSKAESLFAPNTTFGIQQLINNSINSTTWWASVSGYVSKWFYKLGNDLTLNETQLNDSIDARIAITYYNASVVSLIEGTPAGSLSDTNIYDGVSYNITETGGSPGLDIRFNFTSVDDFNEVIIRMKMDGMLHEVDIQLYDYILGDWENYATIFELGSYQVIELGVYDSSDHLSGNLVQLRFYMADPGNTNHKYFFDWIQLVKGAATFSTNEIDPLSLHIVDLPLENQTISHCSNITGNASDLCTITPGGLDGNASSICSDNEVLLGQDAGVCVNLNNTIDDRDTNESDQIYNLNDSWLSTYNATYDTYLDSNNSLAIWIDTLFIRFTELVSAVGNWSADKSSYVPYTGADTNLDLGSNNFSVDSSVLFVDSDNDRVGIGTTSPNAPLEIVGAISGVVGGFQGGELQVRGNGAEFYNSVITGHNSFNTNTQLWYLGSTSSLNNDIAFINRQNASLKFSTNNTERMRIDKDGNVGINTTNPTHALNVVGDINITGLIYGNGSSLTNVPTYNATYDTYLDSNDTLATWIDSLFIRFTEVVGAVGNWTLDKVNYLTNTEVNNTIRIEGLLLGFNSTYNATYDANIDTNESDQIYNLNDSWLSTYNVTYNTWAYNMTTPAEATAVSYNNSLAVWINAIFLKISDLAYTVIWDTDFNTTFDDRDSDTQLTENQVEAFILDSDNTANLDLNDYDIKGVENIMLQDVSGACDISTSGNICMNATGVYIVG